ncbi:MAG: sugar phosphate isomerase/epimerase family protein [Pirellulales bacterium]
MRIGYNTNGFAHHAPLDALSILAELGYRSIAVTLDHQCLNPFAPDLSQQLADYQRRIAQLGLHTVVETGARFLLDPRTKHEPTLVTADAAGRARRVDFLKRAIDIAAQLGSDCISFWSGIVRDAAPTEAVWRRLVESLQPVLDHASHRQVAIGFEPEPGMFIDTMNRYDELVERLGAPAHFRLTLDVGHLHCQGETPLADYIHRYAPQLVNVHLEDMRAGVHDHLMFGEGEIDFRSVMTAFRDIQYAGGIHVELSRHSHEAPTAAQRSLEFLRKHHP